GAGQLAIDEDRATSVLAARPEIVGRDEAINDRIESGGLVGGQELQRARLDRGRRIGLARLPRHLVGNRTGQRRTSDGDQRGGAKKLSTRRLRHLAISSAIVSTHTLTRI